MQSFLLAEQFVNDCRYSRYFAFFDLLFYIKCISISNYVPHIPNRFCQQLQVYKNIVLSQYGMIRCVHQVDDSYKLE